MTWNISQDQFTNLMTATPRLLSGDNPPDLIRLPSMVVLVKDGLLKNLDSYVTAYGWDKFPPAQLAQNRVAADGTRGSGSLYAAGLNYSLTGVFYNKKLAEQIGMTEPPTTVAEFEDLLAKAKTAGAPADHGLERHGQRRRARLPAPEPHGGVRPDRTDQRLDLPEGRTPRSTRRATSRPPSTSSNGSSPATSPRTSNAIEYTDAQSRFGKGEGVFMFNGDWQNAGYDKDLSGNVGFFVFPPARAAASSPRCQRR